MAQTDVFGVNEPKLDLLVLDIGETAERISNKLNLIDKLVYDTSSFYECESGNVFRANFEKIKDNFPVVNRNILAYSADLVRAKGKVYSTEDTIAQNFSQATGTILSNSTERYSGKN